MQWTAPTTGIAMCQIMVADDAPQCPFLAISRPITIGRSTSAFERLADIAVASGMMF